LAESLGQPTLITLAAVRASRTTIAAGIASEEAIRTKASPPSSRGLLRVSPRVARTGACECRLPRTRGGGNWHLAQIISSIVVHFDAPQRCTSVVLLASHFQRVDRGLRGINRLYFFHLWTPLYDD
jgi:hypothetical protein